MTSVISKLVRAAILGFGLWSGAAEAAERPRIMLAQTSCSGFQSMCAARCKERAPTDATCVDDHCTPKRKACLSSGCWQEGRIYGGKETCKLKKS